MVYPNFTVVHKNGGSEGLGARGSREFLRIRQRARAGIPAHRQPSIGGPGRVAGEDDCPYVRWPRFEWDPRKAAANLLAHGVRFAEAVTVLEDDFALTREDDDTLTEKRFVAMGLSDGGRLLVVVFAYRDPDMIRIVSAWKASRRQRLIHEKSRS